MITSDKLLMIPLILVLAMIGGLWYFLINQLPKKIGYPKFILACLGYFLYVALITTAVSMGRITGILFIALLLAVPVIGAICLRHELIDELKNAFKNE